MDVAKIDTILKKYNGDSDFLIEILQDVQTEWRYLPVDLMRHLADELGVPLARVSHIATFYKAFSLEPRGEHEIQVCMGTACHVKGASRVLDAMSRELGIEEGQTTADKKYTLEAVRCVGACGVAPVVVIDDEYHGDLMPDASAKLISRHMKEGAR